MRMRMRVDGPLTNPIIGQSGREAQSQQSADGMVAEKAADMIIGRPPLPVAAL